MTLMERDYRNRLEGRAEGKVRGKIELLLDLGWEIDSIAKKLNISEEKVKKIIDSLDE